MPKQLYTNNAVAELDVNCDIGDTTITLEAGAGALFATPGTGEYQMATLVNLANNDIEIVKITDNTSDVLTVDRAQEGTTEANFPAATSKIEARLTAGMLDRIVQNQGDDLYWDVAIGRESVADNDSTAVGVYAQSENSKGVAIGYSAEVFANEGISIGAYARSRGVESFAVGDTETFGAKSISIGNEAKAYGAHSFAIGEGVKSFANNSSVFRALPCVNKDNGSVVGVSYPAGAPPYQLAATPVVISSPWVDLGQGVTWQATTAYDDGDVVYPTTPNGFQYALDVDVIRDFNNSTSSFVQNYSLTSGGTEPTWPTTDYAVVAANSSFHGQWIAMDWVTDGIPVKIPDGMIFYPDEVGFICYNFDAVTAEPYVSIGTHAAPTALVNNQQLTDITDDNMRHRFTGLKKGITGDINFKLITKATGASSRFHGRFYAVGILIQKQDQA